MNADLRNIAESCRGPRLAAALTLTAIALAGCGGGGGEDASAEATPAGPSTATAAGSPEPILIKTRFNLPALKIMNGSTIGGSSFCPGGTATDVHGTPDIGLVDRMIICQDGTLRMGFDPQLPDGNTQRGPWRIASGTGAYKGWEGSGEMVTTYEPKDNSQHPTKGIERFAGTVTHWAPTFHLVGQ